MVAAEAERAAEGRYWLARMMEAPHQDPQKFMYYGGLIEKNYFIAKIHWLRYGVDAWI